MRHEEAHGAPTLAEGPPGGKGPAAAAAVACLSLASSPLVLRAQSSPDPATEFVPAVWVAESEGLLKLRADTGAELFELGEAGGVRAVAVDDRRSLVWAYTPGTLKGYTLGGVLSRSVPVPVPADYTDATPVALAVNLGSGAVWLSVGTTLRQVTETGALLTAQSLTEAPRVLAYDLLTARLWFGTAHHVVALDDAGVQVATLNLDDDTVHDLAVDPTSGDLWVASNHTLRRYDVGLVLQADTRIPSLKWVAADGQGGPDEPGGVWQTTPQDLLLVNAAGAGLERLDPWPGPWPLVTVAADLRDGSVWVASHTAVSHVARDAVIGPVVGNVAWTYDTDFRVATEAVNGSQSVTYGYNPDSLVTQAGALSLTRAPQTGFLTGTSLGVVTDSHGYSPFGEPASYTARVGAPAVFAVGYQRDALGRIREKTETVEGATTVWGYGYDEAGRLEGVTRDGVEVARYAYDLNGNRLTATRNGVPETAEYDAQDRLLRYGAATYTYTANGELRTKTDPSGTTWRTARRMRRIPLDSSRAIGCSAWSSLDK